MSCMDHRCRDCGHDWCDNHYRGDCPSCGSGSVAHFFDEHERESTPSGAAVAVFRPSPNPPMIATQATGKGAACKQQSRR